jgi:hypothetical protein
VTDHRSPPPTAEECLVRTYASRNVRGGTQIAEDVMDLVVHESRVRTGAYRPPRCVPCGGPLHIHDYRARILPGSEARATDVVRFRCADRATCGAVVQVLPAFIARHLWRTWATVASAVCHTEASGGSPPPLPAQVPARTTSRWRARLRASAAALIVALATTSLGRLLAEDVGLGGTRADVVDRAGAALDALRSPSHVFASLAALLHRSAPGIRLM